MEVLQLLKDAREILTPDGAWTTGAMARSKWGSSVPTHSARAVSFCMTGGLVRALCFADEDGPSSLEAAARGLLLEAIPVRGRPDYLYLWNDRQRRTQAQVLACYDRAIAKVEKEEAKRG